MGGVVSDIGREGGGGGRSKVLLLLFDDGVHASVAWGRGGRGGKAAKAAKAAPAQGTRKSARGKGAQAGPQSAVESTKAVGGKANLVGETGVAEVQVQAATEAATTAEGVAQAATEGAPPAQV